MINTEASQIPDDTEYEYPRLGMWNNGINSKPDEVVIVLFIRKNHGYVLHATGDSSNTIGHYSERWVESNFRPFHGTLTIEFKI